MGDGPWESKEAFKTSDEHKRVRRWLEYVFLRELNLEELKKESTDDRASEYRLGKHERRRSLANSLGHQDKVAGVVFPANDGKKASPDFKRTMNLITDESNKIEVFPSN